MLMPMRVTDSFGTDRFGGRVGGENMKRSEQEKKKAQRSGETFLLSEE